MLYDLLIIGAGPAGLALAAEARAAGVDSSRVLVLEKGDAHSWAIRQFYPEQKLTTVNYKGFAVPAEGLLSISDMTKAETVEYFDKIVRDYDIKVVYGAEVYAMRRVATDECAQFRVESGRGSYQTKVLAAAVGILGRPNKPKEYKLPATLRERLLFDITSRQIAGEEVLVVGGGDTAAEYVQILAAAGNRTTLSYRRAEFPRMNEQNRAAVLDSEARGGIKIWRDSNITRIDDDAGKARVFFAEEARHAPHTFDRVVYAFGGTTPTNFLRMLGIEFDERGPLFDAAGMTNVPGLFMIGDLVVGRAGGSITTAFNSAARAMNRIREQFLHCGENTRTTGESQPQGQ